MVANDFEVAFFGRKVVTLMRPSHQMWTLLFAFLVSKSLDLTLSAPAIFKISGWSRKGLIV